MTLAQPNTRLAGRRGTTLATTLVLSSLAFMTVSLVAAWASAEAIMATNQEARQRAEALANGVVHRALAAYCSNCTDPQHWEIRDSLGRAQISFDPTWAQQAGIPSPPTIGWA